jgi:hypothetical protein
MMKMTSYWKCTTSEITKSFQLSSGLECYNESKDCGEASVQQIAVKCQRTSEDQETEEGDMTEHEQVTKQDAMKFIAGL